MSKVDVHNLDYYEVYTFKIAQILIFHQLLKICVLTKFERPKFTHFGQKLALKIVYLLCFFRIGAINLDIFENKLTMYFSFSEPEYLANPNLDELSGMTYLSYFMKEEDSPGYYATLNWVKNQIPNQRINNFRVSTNLGIHVEIS